MRLIWNVLFLFNIVAQPMGIGQGGQKKAPIMKSDLPYIACQTCKELIHYAYEGVHELRQESKPGKPVRESDIYGLLEKVCDPETEEGEWIGTFDLVESGSELKLVEQETIGFCESECRTIARACSDLIEEFDYSLSEALYANDVHEAKLIQRFCFKVSDVCAKPTPPLPENRPEGPPFIPMTEDDYKMKKMMEQMKAMGLGGQVFDQDSAREFIAERYGNEDGDDELETEEPIVDSTTPTPIPTYVDRFHQFAEVAYEKANEGYRFVEAATRKFFKRITSRSNTKETEL
eukprot:g6346.t1